jgi:transcriptional regulator with XRE-family HTH domain
MIIPFVEQEGDMARKPGRGNTPLRIQKMLEEAVKTKSQNVIARELGIGVAVVNRYLKGIGEPTTETLEKLADYFDVTVDFLRGKDTYELPAALKLLDIYFEFLESLPDDRQGQAMLFSKFWFEELYYKITMYLSSTPATERDKTLESLDHYITQCIQIKSKFRNWQIETGGLLGQWNPYDQDIFIPLDNEQNSDSVLIGATPSGGGWKVTKAKTAKTKQPSNDPAAVQTSQQQPVKESGQDHKQQRNASKKKAKP